MRQSAFAANGSVRTARKYVPNRVAVKNSTVLRLHADNIRHAVTMPPPVIAEHFAIDLLNQKGMTPENRAEACFLIERGGYKMPWWE